MNLSECAVGIFTPDQFHTAVIVLFSLVVIVGLFGNALVIIVIAANRHMRSSTNTLITSLAVADLLFITFCVPFTALIYKFTWRFGHMWCVLFQYFSYVPVYVSVYTLVLMSVDRYLAVVHPIRSISWRTQRNAASAVTATWLVIAVGHVPFALGVQVSESNCSANCNDHGTCETKLIGFCGNGRLYLDMGQSFSPEGMAFYTAFNALGYVVPFAVIITLYVLLVKRLLFSRRSKLAKSMEAVKSKRRVTRTVVTVVLIFGTCWLPIHVVFALQLWHGDIRQDWFRYLQSGSQVLAYANSCLNPIVYAFVSENFRQAFAKLLRIRLPRKAEAVAAGNRRPLLLGEQQQHQQQRDQLQKMAEVAMATNDLAPGNGAGTETTGSSKLLRNTLELTAVQVHCRCESPPPASPQ